MLTLSASSTPQACENVIDGSVSVTPTGGSPGYTYLWNLGYRDSVVHSLPTGTYRVTVTDSHGCTASDSATVIFAPSFAIAATVQQPLCSPVDNGAIIPSVSGGAPAYNFVWNTTSHADSLKGLMPGVYSFTVTDANGCSLSDTFTLVYQTALTVKADSATTIDLGSSTPLTAQVNRGGSDLSFAWTPEYWLACATCQSAEAAPLRSSQYTIQVTDTNGCKAIDSTWVYVNKGYDIYIPNAFTPNGDSRNDYFEIYGKKQSWKYAALRVFDRWGELVYESTDLNPKWDGTYKGVLQEPNVYVYKLDVTFIDGHSISDQKGSVTLLR